MGGGPTGGIGGVGGTACGPVCGNALVGKVGGGENWSEEIGTGAVGMGGGVAIGGGGASGGGPGVAAGIGGGVVIVFVGVDAAPGGMGGGTAED
jgi:hypothetical protein